MIAYISTYCLDLMASGMLVGGRPDEMTVHMVTCIWIRRLTIRHVLVDYYIILKLKTNLNQFTIHITIHTNGASAIIYAGVLIL